MAFRRDTQQIYPGSINLLAPGDQVANGDWLALANFRPDSAGKLIQALGIETRTADEGAFQIDSLCALKAERYYGCTRLWKYAGLGLAGTLITTGFDGSPLGLLGYQNFLWIMNRTAAKQLRVAHGTTTAYNWTPETGAITSVAASGAVGQLAAGTHEYYVTFEDGGWEGQPSAVTTRVTVLNDVNRITRPAATEGCTDGWNVYVKRPGLSEPLKLNNTAIAIAAVTYDDDGTAASLQDDDSLLDRGVVLEQDHQAAPAARVMANKPYNGRLVVASSATYPNRLFYTKSLKPWYFPDTQYLDVGEDDAILAITVRPNMLIIYKERSIWRHTGDLGEGVLEIIAPDCGAMGIRAVAATSDWDYFAGREGLYMCNGDSARKMPISAKLGSLWRGEAAQIAQGAAISMPGLSATYLGRNAVGQRNGRLWFSYTSTLGGVTYPDRTFTIDLATDRIVQRDSGTTTQGWSVFYDEGQDGYLLGGRNGFFDAIEYPSYADNASSQEVAAHSAYYDQGRPDNLKEYADLVIPRYVTGNPAANLTVKVYTNNGKNATTYNPGGGAISRDEVSLGTISATTPTEAIFRLNYPTTGGGTAHPRAGKPIRGKNIAVRIEGTTNNASTIPIEIDGPLILHYRVIPRDTHDWDSGEIDLGKVHEIDEINVEIDSEGSVTPVLSTAIPGGTLTSIGAITAIAATTDMQPVTRAFTAAAGQLVRLQLYCAANVFRLASVRIRVRGIGVYLDGAVGQSYKTREEAIGI